MKILEIPFGSAYYQQALQLRIKVLRAPLGLKYTPDQLAEESKDVQVVAIENNQVIGVILLRHITDEVLKMRQFAVDPAWQKQGIGSEMVSYCEDYAIEHGYSTIELHARESAVRFYQQLEYEKIGERFMEVTIPHFKMIKQLED